MTPGGLVSKAEYDYVSSQIRKVFGLEPEERRIMAQEYVMSMAFDELAIAVNRDQFMGDMKQAIEGKLRDKMRREGYMDGSYRVEFLVQAGTYGLDRSRLYAKATVDESMKVMPTMMGMNISTSTAVPMDSMVFVPNKEPVAPPAPVPFSDETLKIRRNIKITGDI